jgi:rare lipoprotein A
VPKRCFSMGNNNLHARLRASLALGVVVLLVGGTASRCLADGGPTQAAALEQGGPEESLKNTQATRNAEKVKHHVPDFSARKRMGKASFYANEFAGRKMADGAAMDPRGDNAASKTLPLGTTAKVTNLETGKSAVVTIQDRGPYVPGRIVDLSPATARQIGISHRKGVALVVVAPIAVPQADGRIKLGAAAHESLADTTVSKAIRDASVDTRTVQR